MDASTSSIGWSAGSGRRARRSAWESCTRQPGFALAEGPGLRWRGRGTPCGRRARGRRRAARRCRYPAEPQHRSCSSGSTTSSPGIAPQRRERRKREALRVAEVARVLERDRRGSGCRVARGRASASSSPTSRTFSAKRSARSSPSSQPSSFKCDPQPDELTTTSSTSSRASMSRRAKRLPSSSRPACTESAPQQPCGGATTSKPSAARTRAVAAFTSENTPRCTQPVRSPTRRAAPPSAGSARRPHPALATAAQRPRRRSRFGNGSARPTGSESSATRMRAG